MPGMKNFDKRLLLAWWMGVPATYFAASYLENFYRAAIHVVLWTVLLHSAASLFAYYLLGRAARDFKTGPLNAGLVCAVLAALTLFVPAVYYMAKPFPNLFDSSAFHLPASMRVSFAVSLLPAFFSAAALLGVARKNNWKDSRLYQFLDRNLEGLLAALLFFCVYLLFASVFNRPTFNEDDIFFDADGRLYRWRFATDAYRDYYWRPAHPFILILIRPLVGILAFLFNGDALFAGFTLNALTAALCVFLVWYFVQRSVGIPLYATLICVLFGGSSTQLVFGSVMESYIHLSAVALAFLVLLLKEKPLWLQILAGLTAFGITISNVAQTFIAHLFVRRNIKQLVLYGVIVGALTVPLSLLNNAVYPDSQPYFWDLSTLAGEGHNQFPATLQRAEYLARVMALHSVVAPEPLTIDDEFEFTKIWMFRAAIKKEPMRLAKYESPLGNGLAVVWAGLLVLGGMLFLKNISKRYDGYSLALVATLLFYFALHLRYGKDVFLYSANWAYAVVLFLALTWRELAGRRWFQVLLFVFTLLLLLNNSFLYRTMLEVSAPHAAVPVWK